MSGDGLVSQSEYQEGISETGVGCEDLSAVDYIEVAILLSGGDCACNVRSCIGLGQAEASDLAAVCQRAEPFLFLLGSCELFDAGSAKRSVNGKSDAGAGVNLGDLFHHQAVGQDIHACAADFIRERDAEEAKLLHFGDDVHIHLFFFVHFLGYLGNLVLSEFAEQFLHFLLVFCQLKAYHIMPP